MIYRDTRNGVVAGVCAGLARHYKIDITAVRAAFLAAFVFLGAGPLIYLIMWLLMPSD